MAVSLLVLIPEWFKTACNLLQARTENNDVFGDIFGDIFDDLPINNHIGDMKAYDKGDSMEIHAEMDIHVHIEDIIMK